MVMCDLMSLAPSVKAALVTRRLNPNTEQSKLIQEMEISLKAGAVTQV